MLDFSETAQKVQMVQHYDHFFLLQTVISNRWHYELFISKGGPPMKNRRHISALYQQINSISNFPVQNMTVSNCPVQNMTDARRKRLADTWLNRKYMVDYMLTSCLIFVQTDVCSLLFGKQTQGPQFLWNCTKE